MGNNNHDMGGLDIPIITSQFQPFVERVTFLEAQVEQLLWICEDQNAQLQALRESSLTTHSGRPSEPKIADPEPFTGLRSELLSFLSKCRLKFAGQPSKFPNQSSKIYYAGSYLHKTPYSWFQPLLSAAHDPELPDPEEFASFETFAKALTNIYGDPLLELSSERSLNNLTQTGSVAVYTAEFQRLRQYVKWNEAALIGRYYNGLNDDTKDEIMPLRRPDNLKAIQDLAARFDARMFECRQEKKHSTSPVKSMQSTSSISAQAAPSMSRGPSYSSVASPRLPVPPTPSRTPSPLSVPPAPTTALKTLAFMKDGTVPMEIGYVSMYRGPLTMEEKLYRRQNNLCGYCADPSHDVFNCTRARSSPTSQSSWRPQNSTVTAEFQVPPKDNAEE
jgi:hypothetical protein